jgi:CDP-diacylglycerol--glycerol-3-phosphate 3-phosphatidyltransferase
LFTLVPHTLPKRLTEPVGQTLARTGITPNMITVAGLAGASVAAVLVAFGQFLAGGIVMMAAAALDLLDGIVARARAGHAIRRCLRLGMRPTLRGCGARRAGVSFRQPWQARRGGAGVRGGRRIVARELSAARAEAAGLQLREGFFHAARNG